jgi:hypothetical protein
MSDNGPCGNALHGTAEGELGNPRRAHSLCVLLPRGHRAAARKAALLTIMEGNRYDDCSMSPDWATSRVYATSNSLGRSGAALWLPAVPAVGVAGGRLRPRWENNRSAGVRHPHRWLRSSSCSAAELWQR